MNTPPDSATVEMSYMARTNSALMTMAPTMASWKRRLMTDAGTPAARSSSNAWKVGSASRSSTEVSCAVLVSVAVFFSTMTA